MLIIDKTCSKTPSLGGTESDTTEATQQQQQQQQQQNSNQKSATILDIKGNTLFLSLFGFRVIITVLDF